MPDPVDAAAVTDPAGLPAQPPAVQAPAAVDSKLVIVTVLVPVLYAVLAAVQDNTVILDGLPPWLRALILAVVPPLLGFLAGYRAPSNRVEALVAYARRSPTRAEVTDE
jgi:hypothetical protein